MQSYRLQYLVSASMTDRIGAEKQCISALLQLNIQLQLHYAVEYPTV